MILVIDVSFFGLDGTSSILDIGSKPELIKFDLIFLMIDLIQIYILVIHHKFDECFLIFTR